MSRDELIAMMTDYENHLLALDGMVSVEPTGRMKPIRSELDELTQHWEAMRHLLLTSSPPQYQTITPAPSQNGHERICVWCGQSIVGTVREHMFSCKSYHRRKPIPIPTNGASPK